MARPICKRHEWMVQGEVSVKTLKGEVDRELQRSYTPF